MIFHEKEIPTDGASADAGVTGYARYLVSLASCLSLALSSSIACLTGG